VKEISTKSKLAAAISQIEKLYGKGSLIEYGKGTSLDIKGISTGSFLINDISGIGGIPMGRITEIYGPESSGKTTMCLHIIAEAQKMGMRAAFIDAEHALDPVYARNIGVNMDTLLLSQPDYGEQALDIASKLTETGEVGLIIIDSVAALVPKAEIEGEIGDAHMALQARMMSQSLRMMNGDIKKTNTAVVFINQLRSKIGVMFGNPETTTGGNALKFYASMRIDIRRIGAIKEGEEVVGNITKVKIAKSKVSSPFRTCEIDIRYAEGIDCYSELIELGVKHNVLEKSGAWYIINDKHKYQGKEKIRQALKSNEKLYIYLRKKIFGE
jgi:recombination protein RecA